MKFLIKMQKPVVIFAMSLLLFVAPFSGQAEASSQAANITKTATSLMGIKYSYGGTTKSGFDCSGFVSYVFKENAINVARTASSMYASGQAVSKSNLETGDLVFFNTTGKGVSHVGIYMGNGKFAHASTSRGVRVDKLTDPYYWGDRYIGAKRISNGTTVASAS
ncbi:C40 family peptidase [Sporosarcina sp. NPDC096371]|uniref:C40 family peptidase n=1 Tax=Sporosarcina sp. NPDC096371 TaxID=3364530 RepID=UPI00380360A7